MCSESCTPISLIYENLGDLCDFHPRSGAERVLIRILNAERKLLRVLVFRSDCAAKSSQLDSGSG
jgi:hypothetical protein